MAGPSRVCLLLIFVLLSASAPVELSGALAQDAPALPEQRYDIAAQPLDLALGRYSEISQVDIIYNHELASGRRSAPIGGRYTPQQALMRILTDTGLSFRFTGPDAVLIYQTQTGSPAAASGSREALSVMTLDPMYVRAAPIIGTRSRREVEAYGQLVQTELDALLRRDAQRAGGAYRAVVAVWIDERGIVERAEFLRGSQDRALEGDMLRKMTAFQLSQSPPNEMPQPIRLQMEAR
jgi:hypothetical protein